MVSTVAYLFVWLLGTYAFFDAHNFEAITLLGVITLPSSLAVSALHTVLGLKSFVFDLVGFLVLGGLQYALIGYAFGMMVQWVLKQAAGTGKVP
jgi:hypothetical protein